MLVRFADDLLVMCKSAEQARAAFARLRELLADLGLEPKEAKTPSSIWRWAARASFSWFPPPDGALVGLSDRQGHVVPRTLARRQGHADARDQIRDLTVRSRLRVSPEVVVQEINWFLSGWTAYFRYGHSAARFTRIMYYVTLRLAIFIGKRHNRGRRFGRTWSLPSPDRPA